jgi:glycosyltransferase involved in cell wall biosynthesis
MIDQLLTYSVVIPIFNEEKTIPELYKRLTDVMKELKDNYEIIFIDDGSKDLSLDLIQSFSIKDKHIKCVSLSRNFGHQIAISAGIRYSSGQATILMDGDLQDPPEIIPSLVKKWEQGFEVVYAIRKKRKENILKRFLYKLFYLILRKLSHIEIPLDTGDFSLIDKRVVDLLNSMPEKNRFIRGIRAWIGLKQIGVEYEREPRFAGTSKYSLRKLIALALDGIVSFSYWPLKLATKAGFFISIASFLGGLFYFIYWLLRGDAPKGFTTLAILILLLAGIQFIMIGIMGEYIGRIHEEVKNRPLFIAKKLIGIEDDTYK